MHYFAQKLHLWILLVIVVGAQFASGQPNGVTLLDTLNRSHGVYSTNYRFSACWGWVSPTGHEYALIGTYTGESIIDLDVSPIREIAFIPGNTATYCYREAKTYKNYAYIVSEGGRGVQIVDLSQLPDTAILVREFNYTSTSGNILRSHSVALADGYLYLNGSANWSPGGVVIFSLLNDPTNPQYVGQFETEYIHDCYVRNDTMYAAAIYSGGGLDIVDLTNKANPQIIRKIMYAGSGTHHAWLSMDKRYAFTTDEIGSTPSTLKVWDLPHLNSSPPDTEDASYRASPVELIHNVHGRGNYAYVSHYTAGMRVVDVHNPLLLSEVGRYDTYPGASATYNGCWGVYPYFFSGRWIGSDMQTGLYLCSFSGLAPRIRSPLLSPANGGVVSNSLSTTFRWRRAALATEDPHYYQLHVFGTGVDTLLKATDSSLAVSPLAGFQNGQTYSWHVWIKDEYTSVSSQDTFQFTFAPPPPATPTLSSPLNGAVNRPLTLTLQWNASPLAVSYRLQVSTDSLFGSTVFDDSTITTLSQQVGPLLNATPYFWRVNGKNAAGTGSFSAIWKFTTTAEITVSYQVASSWGLVSIPLTVSDGRKPILFPTARSNAYMFVPSTGYEQSDTLVNGPGYFLKFDSTQNVNITGVPRRQDTIHVSPGWNLIGSISDPIDTSSVIQSPPGIIQSVYYGYAGAYSAADTIKPAKGYWVKANASGQLIFGSAAASARSILPMKTNTISTRGNAKKP